MPTTREVARSEMFDVILNAEAALLDLLPSDVKFEMRWQGIETPDEVKDAAKQMVGKFWTRAIVQTLDSRQAAHSDEDAPGITKPFVTVGQVIVQVFAPRNVIDSFNLGDLLAGKIADIYRIAETPSGVWFRRATAREAASEHSFWRWNVTAEFEYYERT